MIHLLGEICNLLLNLTEIYVSSISYHIFLYCAIINYTVFMGNHFIILINLVQVLLCDFKVKDKNQSLTNTKIVFGILKLV